MADVKSLSMGVATNVHRIIELELEGSQLSPSTLLIPFWLFSLISLLCCAGIFLSRDGLHVCSACKQRHGS